MKLRETGFNMASLWELGDLETPWCIRVAATLRIADYIAAGHSEIRELATEAGADADALQRVLRHLVRKGVFEEPVPGRFELLKFVDEPNGRETVAAMQIALHRRKLFRTREIVDNQRQSSQTKRCDDNHN